MSKNRHGFNMPPADRRPAPAPPAPPPDESNRIDVTVTHRPDSAPEQYTVKCATQLAQVKIDAELARGAKFVNSTSPIGGEIVLVFSRR